MSDIDREGSPLIICIRTLNTARNQQFVDIDNIIEYSQIFNKYIWLRPNDVTNERVFYEYIIGKHIKC